MGSSLLRHEPGAARVRGANRQGAFSLPHRWSRRTSPGKTHLAPHRIAPARRRHASACRAGRPSGESTRPPTFPLKVSTTCGSGPLAWACSRRVVRNIEPALGPAYFRRWPVRLGVLARRRTPGSHDQGALGFERRARMPLVAPAIRGGLALVRSWSQSESAFDSGVALGSGGDLSGSGGVDSRCRLSNRRRPSLTTASRRSEESAGSSTAPRSVLTRLSS